MDVHAPISKLNGTKHRVEGNAMTEQEVLEDVIALVDAMWQLLDDMGRDGLCVCPAAKAQARIAFEPFHRHEHGPMAMSMEEAIAVRKESEK